METTCQAPASPPASPSETGQQGQKRSRSPEDDLWSPEKRAGSKLSEEVFAPFKSLKSKFEALPTVRDHTTDNLTIDQDEYMPREHDERGEQKVSPTGEPLGNREFKMRTFFLPQRGEKRFMLATECARVLGYRDSYLLFYKNRSLYSITATKQEKDELIGQEILPYSNRPDLHHIAIVTAKSMFRQFGARVIEGGRRVRDDYWEAKAIQSGFTEEDMASDKRPGATKAKDQELAAAAEANRIFPTPVRYGHSQQHDIFYTNATMEPPDHSPQVGASPVIKVPEDSHIPAFAVISRPRQASSAAPYRRALAKAAAIKANQASPSQLSLAAEKLAKTSSDQRDNHDLPLTEYTQDRMLWIKSYVLNQLSPSDSWPGRASLTMEWDLPKFMKDQYLHEDKPSLGSVITLSGSGLCAQAATCSQYMQCTWPAYGARTFAVFQRALDSLSHSAEDSDTDIKLDVFLGNGICSVDVQCTRPIDVAYIFQQVIWLGAALRVSDSQRIKYSDFRLKHVVTMKPKQPAWFDVTFESSELPVKEQSCWISLFTNSVVARGFPIPQRENEEVGLEIPLEMMASLGGARHITPYDGGLVLKGFSVMFVPIRRHRDSIQWHLIKAKDDSRMLYRELKDHCQDRALLTSVDYESLIGKRAFLGWWKDAESHLGTEDAAYSTIDWTNTEETKRSTRVSAIDVGFQNMVTGKLGFIMGPKDGRLHFSRSGPFQKIIHCASKTPVALYDTEDQRAWFVPALDVMLHIILTRLRLSLYHVDGEEVQLTSADPQGSNGNTVRDAINKNRMKKLYDSDKGTGKDHYFQDEILDIWSQMERLMEKDTLMEAVPGVAVHGTMRSKLRGWEYRTLVDEKNYWQKETNITKSSGGWVDLINDLDVLVLFAKGFGEIIKPASDINKLCCRWRNLPTGRDYLATGTPMLEVLYAEAGSRFSRKHLSPSKLQWHRGSALFEPCNETAADRCSCDRTQQIYHDSFLKTFGHIEPPGRLEPNGCVIFGQERHALKPKKTQTPKVNTVYNLPNLPLQGLEASPPRLPSRERRQPLPSAVTTNVHVEEDDDNGGSSTARPLSPLYASGDISPNISATPRRRREMSFDDKMNLENAKRVNQGNYAAYQNHSGRDQSSSPTGYFPASRDRQSLLTRRTANGIEAPTPLRTQILQTQDSRLGP